MVVLVKQNFMDSQVAYTSIDYSILLFLIDPESCVKTINEKLAAFKV